MKYRIALWAGIGFLVAGFWALYVYATFPSANERLQDVWAVLYLTCPVAMLRHHPVSLYEVLAANTATYALAGLMVETVRRQFRHAK